MTNTQLEAAARELCRLCGEDPDEIVSHGAAPDRFGVVVDVLLHSPAWQLAKLEVQDAVNMTIALAAGLAAPEKPE